MPAASQAGVHARWLDRLLAARPELGAELQTLLTSVQGHDPSEVVRDWIDRDPVALEQLLVIVTCAYYMSPKVRSRLGYPGQKPQLPYPDEADWYLRDDLLAPVIARGPVYRPTDYTPEDRHTA
jgi:hypothetical protein